MRLIKLSAIGSTNDYLKELSSHEEIQNFTVVTAETQTNGRGQMGAKWDSQSGKNLTLSVLVKKPVPNISQIFDLNVAVSAAICEVLECLGIAEISIKWPNDIMSGKKKIGGVLIENSVKSAVEISSVIGIGLNVNQDNFEGLPNASSLRLVAGYEFDKWALLGDLVAHLEKCVSALSSEPAKLWEFYIRRLFKKNIPMPFKDAHGQNFMGIITGVSEIGKLKVQLENGSVAEFGLKEITLLY
jgi:BirA family biotin operon repressor/biotin-[acetyl-CoA-carboxylase] ligase